MIIFVRKLSVLMGLITLPFVATGHHSVAAFYDRSLTAEVEGTVTSVSWRNPHIGFTLSVESETGEQQEWEIEGGTFNDLQRQSFDQSFISIGTRVRVVGAPSRRNENAIFLNQVLTPAGEDIIRNARYSLTDTVQDATAESLESGIFRVWVNGGPGHGLRMPLSLTRDAEALIADFDPLTDDPSLRCQAPGMPNANLNPYPIEFVEENDRITLRIEEWDTIRTIYMEAETPDNMEGTPLGYSVGHWEGKTLIIETSHIDYPLLDDSGTPMSGNARIVERYTLSNNDMRLDYEVIVTDPEYLAEAAIWDATWVWESGAEVKPFECSVR
jgi:hypothetical protein